MDKRKLDGSEIRVSELETQIVFIQTNVRPQLGRINVILDLFLATIQGELNRIKLKLNSKS